MSVGYIIKVGLGLDNNDTKGTLLVCSYGLTIASDKFYTIFKLSTVSKS